MAYTTINDPSAHFQIKTWTGNGSDDRNLTNDGNSDLQPDLLWDKRRSTTGSHKLQDSTRGVTKPLISNNSNTEGDESNAVQAFQTDGFQVGNDSNINGSGVTYVAWQWKANGGTRTTFTESGSNPGGGHQANTTAGFSIVDYVGTGSTGTVSHGLGAVPHWILFKNRDTAQTWVVYHHKNTAAPETDILQLEATNATYDSNTYFNDTAPTSSVFTVATSNDLNKDGDNIIAYAWTGIQGYSKFGSYSGNGSATGPFVYLGFRPRWILIKRTDATDDWKINDTARDFNGTYGNDASLHANENIAETTSASFNVDFLSNGFKLRSADAGNNADGGTYVYAAFAEHPYVSSKGVPTTGAF